MLPAINKTKVGELSSADAAVVLKGLHFILDAIGLVLPDIQEEAVVVPDDIQQRAEDRWAAKAAKDWATADEIRKELELKGWIIKDSKGGFEVVPK